MVKNNVRTRRKAASSPLSAAGDRVAAFGDLVEFIWRRKLWWLVPLVLALVLMSALALLGSNPILAPIYPLF